MVADEVRSLAQRSAQAAKETAAKIESAISKTGQGVAITGKVGVALNEILAKARQMDELAGEIATASSEQAEGIGQINLAVGQMDKVTQSNAAHAEENAAAAEELNAQAETMKQLVMALLKLVGGKAADEHFQLAGDKSATYAGKKQPARLGHDYAPAVVPTAQRRAQTPQETSFQDF